MNRITVTAIATAGIWASQSTVAQNSKPEAGLQLEEIVVTARRVEEKLNDVPVAITAFTAEDLAKRNVTSLSDIAAYTAGMSFESYSGNTTPAPVFRGLTQNALTDRNQNVATFVDGVHVQQQGNIDFSQMEIERVEILKGPQNAEYGRSAFAGAILWVPRKPVLGEWDANVGVTFGTDKRRDLRGSVSLPIWQDKLAVRVSASKSQFDGTYKNNFPGSHKGIGTNIGYQHYEGTDGNVGGYNNLTRQVSLRFRPIEALTLDLMYYRAEAIYEAGASLILQPRTAAQVPALGASNPHNCSPRLVTGINQLICGEIKFSPSQIQWDPRASGNHTHSDLFIAHGDYAITDNFGVAVTYGRGTYDAANYGPSAIPDVQIFGDASATARQFVTGNPAVQWVSNPFTDQTSESYELRLHGAFGGVNWALGTYNSDVKDVGAVGNIDYRLPLSLDPTGQIEVRNILSPTAAIITGFFSQFRDKTNSQFLSLGVPFADKWRVEVEARYNSEKRTSFALSGAPPVRNKTFTDFTPRVNLSWKPMAGYNVYASVAKGVKSGGFNGLTADVPAFDPEENLTYELGAKQTLLGGTLQLNYDVFFIDWKNLQLSVPDTIPTPPNTQDPNFIGNVKGATSKGVEIEATMLITDRLRGNLAFSYADSTFKSGVIDTTFGRLCETSSATPACVFLARNLAAGLPLGGSAIGGNALPRTPKTKIGLGLEYAMPVNTWKLTFRGDASYQDKYFVENLNLAYMPSRTLLNLNVSLADSDGRWNVSLWSKNVTDEVYASSAFAVSVINQYIPALGDGRTVGLTATYHFNNSKH